MASQQGFSLKLGQRKKLIPIIIGMLVLAGMLFLRLTAPDAFNRVGGLVFDAYQRAAPRAYEDAGVRVIDIDEESLKKYGQWPWPRTDIAQMLYAVSDSGAAVIAFDMVFSEPDRTSPDAVAALYKRYGMDDQSLAPFFQLPNHDEYFAQAIAETNTVTGYFMTNEDGKHPPVKWGRVIAGDLPELSLIEKGGAILPLDILNEQAKGTGFVSIDPDGDGIIRKAPLLNIIDGQEYPALTLEALRVAQGARSYTLKSSNASGENNETNTELVAVGVGALEIPTTGDGQMYVHFTEDVPERVVPAWKIMDKTEIDQEMLDWFEGRIVYVGTSATGLLDLVATPMTAEAAGVLVHAQMTEQMLLGKFLSRPDWAVGVESMIILIGGLVLVFALPFLGALRGGVLTIFMVGGVLLFSWVQYFTNQILIDPIFPVLGLLVVAIVTSTSSFLMTEAEKAYIKDAFDLYLSPEMVDKIADDPSLLSLGGEERDLTILFCDIRGFSKISEDLGPQQITTFLNNFLTPMTDILMEGKATIDKYIGDAIVSFWNAPLDDFDHHENAARASLKMMSVLREMNAERERDPENAALPVETKIGIGLNSGPCSVGNMGSKQRFAYSVLGDTVNLASRLEGLTKQYGVGIIIGSALAEQLPKFAILELDCLRVVGRDRPEVIFALIGDEDLADSATFRHLHSLHQAFRKAYGAQDWEGAEEILDKIVMLGTEFHIENYYHMMKARVADYKTAPPGDDWDGVHQAYRK